MQGEKSVTSHHLHVDLWLCVLCATASVLDIGRCHSIRHAEPIWAWMICYHAHVLHSSNSPYSTSSFFMMWRRDALNYSTWGQMCQGTPSNGPKSRINQISTNEVKKARKGQFWYLRIGSMYLDFLVSSTFHPILVQFWFNVSPIQVQFRPNFVQNSVYIWSIFHWKTIWTHANISHFPFSIF